MSWGVREYATMGGWIGLGTQPAQTIDWTALLAAVACVVVGLSIAACFQYRRSPASQLSVFFKANAKKLPVVSRTFPMADLPNVQLAIAQYAQDQHSPKRVVGFDGSLRDLAWNSVIRPVRYQDVDIDVDRRMQCIQNGVHLIDSSLGRTASQVRCWATGKELELQVMAASQDLAADFIEEMRERVSKCSIYRGKVISLETNTGSWGGHGWLNVRFHRLPPIRREDIILPDATWTLVERNSVRFFRHSDALRRSGRSLKRGLLFHGEPGTGKTYTAKWLAQSLNGVTVILMSGEQLGFIKECCQMARMLVPSLVIMEDVDLIATARDESGSATPLHQLLNEMDGMVSEAEVIFLLTTNRPHVIEPALAERPGRIDQAIKFPLPDADCRGRLFDLYGRGLKVNLTERDPLIAKTDGASPAFIQELVRKAALIAAEEGSVQADTLCVTDSHFTAALRELMLSGDELTGRFLGFKVSAQRP